MKLKSKIIFLIILIYGFYANSSSEIRKLPATQVNFLQKSLNPQLGIDSNGNIILSSSSVDGSRIYMEWLTSGLSRTTSQVYNNTSGEAVIASVAASNRGGNVLFFYEQTDNTYLNLYLFGNPPTLQNSQKWLGSPLYTSATSLTNGNYVLCWATATEIFLAIYDYTVADLLVNISFAGSVGGPPSTAALSNGNFLVAWTTTAQVYCAIYSNSGASVVSSFVANDSTSANRQNTAVSGLSAGNFIIVWESNESGTNAVYAKIYSNEAVAVSLQEFMVNDVQNNNYKYPVVAQTLNGGFIVFWQTVNNGKGAICFKQFNQNGIATSSENYSYNGEINAGQGNLVVQSHPTLNFVFAYVTPNFDIFMDHASNTSTNPICTSIWTFTQPTTNLNINFSQNISSTLMGVQLLKIKLTSLPSTGNLINTTSNSILALNSINVENQITFSPGTNSPDISFNFVSVDTLGQESAGCTVTINSSDIGCISCNSERLLGLTCPSNYFVSSGSCTACPSTCSACNDSETCTACTKENFLNPLTNQCDSSCPLQYFSDSSNNLCSMCPAGCISCSSSSECLECFDNDILINGLCTKCPSTCITCSYTFTGTYDMSLDGFECLTCISNYFLSSGLCTTCPTTCSTCTDSNTCTSCIAGNFLDPLLNKCFSTCPSQYFSNSFGNVCSLCPSSCLTCESSTICLTCPSKSYLSSGSCTACPTTCKTCTDSKTCTACTTNNFLNPLNNLCDDNCPPQYFGDSSGSCIACLSNCSECSNSNSCISCKTGNFLDTLNGQCDSSCPSQYFRNSVGNVCSACPTNCDVCSGESVCTTCSPAFFLDYGSCSPCPSNCSNCSLISTCTGVLCSSTLVCIKCPSGYFLSSESCTACPNTCITCTDLNTCTSLHTSKFLNPLNNQWESRCPLQYFRDSSADICYICPSSCLTCLDNSICLTCSSNYFFNSGACTACPSTCSTCKDSNTCTACTTDNILNPLTNQCAKSCPSQYFSNIYGNLCLACPLNCSICSNSNLCTICSSNYYLKSGSCTICGSNCSTCDNSQSCISCLNGNFLNPLNYACASTCPLNFFGSIVGNLCLPCPTNCEVCSSSSVCQRCSTSTYLNSGSCSPCPSACKTCSHTLKCTSLGCSRSSVCLTCSQTYFWKSGYCSPCLSTCSSCSDASTCTACSLENFLNTSTNQCALTCPSQYFRNSSGNVCSACSSSCLTCSSSSVCTMCLPTYFLSSEYCSPCPSTCKSCSDLSNCTTCITDNFLNPLNNQCAATCPPQYFIGNRLSGLCTACPTTCKTCTDSNTCINCAANYYLHYLVDNKCYSICPNEYYANTITCESCSSNCQHCVDGKKCTECNINNFLFNNYCYSNCPKSFFNDAPTKSCIACTNSCQNCINPNSCITCRPGFFLQPDLTCGLQCPIGYFASTNPGVCVGCSKNCISCTINQCKTCSQGFYLNLQNNLCYKLCPDGYFANKNTGLCQQCPDNCNNCVDSDTCLICNSSYYLYLLDNHCYNPCPIDFYANTNTNQCNSCSSNCNNCIDSNTCLICKSSYYLYLLDNHCYNPCPIDFYANTNTNQCDSCSTNCNNCIDSNKCTNCAANYYLHYLVDNKCYSICPNEYYANTTTCESCSSNCQHCVDGKKCTECNINNFLFNNYCYSNCPKSFFNDAPTKSCIACTNSCQNCINPNSCITCSPGFFLQPDLTCSSQCPMGYFASTNPAVCVGCSKNCITCTINQCKTCSKGFFLNLQNNLCYKVCPDGYFGNDILNTCDACLANCLKCKNGLQCSVCIDSFYLNPVDMSCVPTCPDFYYGDQVKKTCKGCPSNCVNCQNENDCNICLPNYFLFLQTNQCYNPCPNGFYADIISNQCLKCDQSCSTCNGPNESDCIICTPPKSKVGVKCTISCPGTQIFDKLSSTCIPLNKFISNFSITGPENVDIEIVTSFKITVALEINTLYKNIPLNIQLVWGDIYGGELMSNNQTLTLFPKNLNPGIFSFSVSLVLFDNPISLVKLDVNLRTYKLVPIVQNATALQLQQPIFLDASKSYDERDIGSTSININPIQFQWICPGELEAICSNINTDIFMLTYDDYKEYVQNNGLSFDITLDFKRDVKTSSLIYPITLSEIQTSADTNFWYIAQKTPGTFGEDVIFIVVLLNMPNSNYQLEDFTYYWTIPNFAENNYLNTRRETSLRVRFSDINNIIYYVSCQLTSLRDQTEYTTSFQFQSIPLPLGKCLVKPPVGISGSTLFEITALDWISSNQPLQFAFYYKNYFGINYNIKTFYSQSFISLLPYGTNFFLEATDSKGFVSTINCNVQVQINTAVDNLDSQFFSVLDKFTQNEVYFSNMNSQYQIGYTNFNFIDSLNFINNLFETNQNTLIESNLEKIISFASILNSCDSDLQINSNIELLNNLLENISLELSKISSDLNLITKYAKVADDNFQRYYSNEANKQDVAFFKQNDNIWNNIQTSVYSSLISGKDVAIVTDYCRVTVSKLSRINLNSIKLMTTNDQGLFIVRIIPQNSQPAVINSIDSTTTSSSNDCGYDIESDICIERSEILNKLNSNSLSEIGVFIKVSNFEFVPNLGENSYVFSTNTIKVSLSIDGSGILSRLLSQSNIPATTQTIHYQSYLNLLNLGSTDFTHAIQSTTCVVYDANYNMNATACTSWYDIISKVAMCDCQVTGLIANIYDQTLAELSRVSQFPSLKSSIFNSYSLGVTICLIIVVSLLYLLASLLDINDGYTKQHKVKKYYDIGQNLIIDYTKHGFDKKYGLFKLFFYMVKMTHSLLSIFYTYSPSYSRGLRVLDLYIQIKITFIFTLLPYYFTQNSDFTAIKTARSVADKGTGPGDLSILWSMVYSVCGTICSKIIIGFLNFVYYENILENEANKKYKYMLKTIKSTYMDDAFVYSSRCKNALFKMKTLIVMREAYRDIKRKKNARSQQSLKLKGSDKQKKPNLKIQNVYESEMKSLVHTHLDQIHQDVIITKINSNEIMTHKPIYDISEDVKLDLIDLYDELKKTKVNNILIPRQYSKSKNKNSDFVSTQSEYNYIICSNNKIDIVSLTSLQIIDKKWLNEENRIKKKRSALKAELYLILFISSFIFLVIMITDVYNKYQDNIFKICILPLLSVILIRFMITENVMIFVFTCFMYMLGEKYYNDNRISSNPLSLVFKFVIPGIAKSTHKALLAYRKFNMYSLKKQ